MNANRKLIAASTMTAALAAVVVSFPAMADDYRSWGQTVMVERHSPAAPGNRRADFPQYAQPHHAQQWRVQTERPEFRHRPPVVHQRPVIMHRPVVVERPVYVERSVAVERPTPGYYHEQRSAYAYAPAPVYYDQQPAYQEDERNHAGAVAGAVIGGVIGSQVGDRDSRGMTTLIGAILGGILGSGF